MLLQKEELIMTTIREDTIEALELSIKHWEGMIAWVKTQPPGNTPYSKDMGAGIGRHWGSGTCALCQMFLKHGNDCMGCPIDCHNHRGKHVGGHDASPFFKTIRGKTWGEWLEGAEGYMLPELEKALLKQKRVKAP
jgi:hypothetical protein